MEWFQGNQNRKLLYLRLEGMVSADHSRWPLKLRCSRDQTFSTLCLPHPTSAISVQYFLKNIWLSLPCWWWWWCCCCCWWWCCWWWWSKENSRGKQPSGMTVEKMPGRANLSRVLHCWGASTPSTYEFRSSSPCSTREKYERNHRSRCWLIVCSYTPLIMIFTIRGCTSM